jgi:hypothetical protein
MVADRLGSAEDDLEAPGALKPADEEAFGGGSFGVRGPRAQRKRRENGKTQAAI